MENLIEFDKTYQTFLKEVDYYYHNKENYLGLKRYKNKKKYNFYNQKLFLAFYKLKLKYKKYGIGIALYYFQGNTITILMESNINGWIDVPSLYNKIVLKDNFKKYFWFIEFSYKRNKLYTDNFINNKIKGSYIFSTEEEEKYSELFTIFFNDLEKELKILNKILK